MSSYNDNDCASANLVKAFSYACEMHKHQRRKADDTPYVNHPARVAEKLAQHGILRAEVLAAAILHDVVEDCATSIDIIEDKFGKKVAKIVADVTDDKTLPRGECKRDQVARIGKASDDSKLIKLSDKIDNISGLFDDAPPTWTMARIQGYFVWAYEVVKAASDANGARPLVEEFENMVVGKHFQVDGRRLACIPDFADYGGFDNYMQQYYSKICYETRK